MIVVTGFEPFGKWPLNPSERVVETLDTAFVPPEGLELRTRVLPVAYDAAATIAETLIETTRPEVMLCLGLSGTRERICIERFALNVDDASLADNAGAVRRGCEIDPDAPAAMRSGADLDALCAALRTAGLDVAISNHAGSFVCNHVYFRCLRTVERLGLDTDCVFVHLPMLDEGERRDRTGGHPSAPPAPGRWRLNDLSRATATLLHTLVARRDARTTRDPRSTFNHDDPTGPARP